MGNYVYVLPENYQKFKKEILSVWFLYIFVHILLSFLLIIFVLSLCDCTLLCPLNTIVAKLSNERVCLEAFSNVHELVVPSVGKPYCLGPFVASKGGRANHCPLHAEPINGLGGPDLTKLILLLFLAPPPPHGNAGLVGLSFEDWVGMFFSSPDWLMG